MRRRLSKLSMSCDFVLDCSMTLAWFFKDEVTPYITSVRRGLESGKALVPALWHFEVANALYVSWKRERCTVNEMNRWIKILDEIPIVLAPSETKRSLKDWLSLSIKHQVTAYDASYLALAWETGLPIASLDDKVNELAMILGIERYDPAGLLIP